MPSNPLQPQPLQKNPAQPIIDITASKIAQAQQQVAPSVKPVATSVAQQPTPQQIQEAIRQAVPIAAGTISTAEIANIMQQNRPVVDTTKQVAPFAPAPVKPVVTPVTPTTPITPAQTLDQARARFFYEHQDIGQQIAGAQALAAMTPEERKKYDADLLARRKAAEGIPSDESNKAIWEAKYAEASKGTTLTPTQEQLAYQGLMRPAMDKIVAEDKKTTVVSGEVPTERELEGLKSVIDGEKKLIAETYEPMIKTNPDGTRTFIGSEKDYNQYTYVANKLNENVAKYNGTVELYNADQINKQAYGAGEREVLKSQFIKSNEEARQTQEHVIQAQKEWDDKIASGQILKSNNGEYIDRPVFDNLTPSARMAWITGGFKSISDAENYLSGYKTPDGGYNVTKVVYDSTTKSDPKLIDSAKILFDETVITKAQETFHPRGEWWYFDPIKGTNTLMSDEDRTKILNEKGWNSNYYDRFTRSTEGTEALIARTRFKISDWVGDEGAKPITVNELSQIASMPVTDIKSSTDKERLADNILDTVYSVNTLSTAFGGSKPNINAANVDEYWGKLTDSQKNQVAENYRNKGQLSIGDITDYATKVSTGIEALSGKAKGIGSPLGKIPASIGIGALNIANALAVSLPLSVASASVEAASGKPKTAVAGLAELPIGMAEWALVTVGNRIKDDPVSGVGVLVGELFAPKIAMGLVGGVKNIPLARKISASAISNEPDVGRASITGGMDAQAARALVEDIQTVWNGRPPEAISKYGIDEYGAKAQYYISKALGKDVSITSLGQKEGGIYGIGTAWQMVNKNSGFSASGELNPIIDGLKRDGQFVVDAKYLSKGVMFDSPQLAEQFSVVGLKEGSVPGSMVKFFSEKDLKPLPEDIIDMMKYASTKGGHLKPIIQEVRRRAESGELEPGIYPVYKYYMAKGIPTFELEFIDTPGMKYKAVKGGYPYNNKYGTASIDYPSRITVTQKLIERVENIDIIDSQGKIVSVNLDGWKLDYNPQGELIVRDGKVKATSPDDGTVYELSENVARDLDKNYTHEVELLKAGQKLPLLFMATDNALKEGFKPPSLSKLMAVWALDNTVGTGQRNLARLFAPRKMLTGEESLGISTSVGYNLPKMQFSSVAPLSRLEWALSERKKSKTQQPFTNKEFESAGGKLDANGIVVDTRRYWHEDSPTYTGWVRDRVGGIIREPKSKGILLIDETANQLVGIPKGVYSLPGGGVERGLSIVDNLKKEAKEELGIDLVDTKRLPTYLGKSNEHSAPGTWLVEGTAELGKVGTISRTDWSAIKADIGDAKKIVLDLDDTLVDKDGIAFSGSKQFLNDLKSSGRELYLWTFSTGERANRILRENGLENIFDKVITRDDYGITGITADEITSGTHPFKDIRKIGGDVLIDNSVNQQINFNKNGLSNRFVIPKYKKVWVSKGLDVKVGEINDAKFINSGDSVVVTPATYDILRSIDGFDVSNLIIYDSRWSDSYRRARDTKYSERTGSKNKTESNNVIKDESIVTQPEIKGESLYGEEGRIGYKPEKELKGVVVVEGGEVVSQPRVEGVPIIRESTEQPLRETTERIVVSKEPELVTERMVEPKGEAMTRFVSEPKVITTTEGVVVSAERPVSVGMEQVGEPSMERPPKPSSEQPPVPPEDFIQPPEKTIPVTKASKKAESRRLRDEEFDGAITWKWGFGWWSIKAPYETNKDIAFFRKPPPNAIIIPDAKNIYQTIQQLTGKPPSKKLIIPIGIQTVYVKKVPLKPGAKGAVTLRMNRAAKRGKATGMVRIISG